MEDALVNELLELKRLLLTDCDLLVRCRLNLAFKCKLKVVLLTLAIEQQNKLLVDLEAMLLLVLFERVPHVCLLLGFENYLTRVVQLKSRGVNWPQFLALTHTFNEPRFSF